MTKEFDYTQFKEEAIRGIKEGKSFSGEDNVMLPMIKDLLESAMKAELDIHMESERAQDGESPANRKNGKTTKTIKSAYGSFSLDTPRDRNSTFSPQIVEKQQTFLGDALQDNIISMYSKGLSYKDIQDHFESLYGTKISKGKLTEITDRILPELETWKNRQLEPIYSIVWLDALHYSVRENNMTVKKAVYVILGYDMYGKKDILGLYIGASESSKFWLSVLEDLQNRGVQDILIACMDNLSGFTQAVESIYPLTDIQLCVIHQIRNSMKYVSHKNSKFVMADLKNIYKAPNLDAASKAMDEFESKWNDKYPLIVKSWRNNWLHLTRFFDYSKDIRRIMYTTNIIEGFNRQLRKYTKTKGAFAGDNALMKLLYMASMNISQKWTGKPGCWGQVQQQLIIKFEERCGISI